MASNNQTIRIGVVGAGRFSRARVLPELQKIDGVELVTIANSSPESTSRVAQEFGIPQTAAGWQDVVSSPDVDLVYNGTQAPQHRDILLGALENDKHLFTMNPLSMTADEGREIVRALEARPHLKARQYQAFPHGPFSREDALVTRLLGEGRIGSVLHANVVWHTPYLALGSYFDILNRWLGAHTRLFAVRKQHEVDGRRMGVTEVVAELENDRMITYYHNNVALPGAQSAHVAIHGSKGSIFVEAYPATPTESVRVVVEGDSEPQVAPVPDDLAAPYNEERFVNVEEQYIAWLRGGAAPTPLLLTLQQGRASLLFAEAFVASMRQNGAWVDVPQE